MVGPESKNEEKPDGDRKIAGPLRIKPEGVEKKPEVKKVDIDKTPPPPVLPRKIRTKQVAAREHPVFTILFVLCVILGIGTVIFLTHSLLGKEIQTPALKSVVEFCRKVPVPGKTSQEVEQSPVEAEDDTVPQADAEED